MKLSPFSPSFEHTKTSLQEKHEVSPNHSKKLLSRWKILFYTIKLKAVRDLLVFVQ